MSYANDITQGFSAMGLGDRPNSRYDQPPPGQGHGQYGYHSGQGQPTSPPAQYYASPPMPTYQPPSDKPPLPQGWIPLFDQRLQRWYYVNRETSVTQWEAPGYLPPVSRDSRNYGAPGGAYGSGAPSPYPPSAPYGQTPGGYGPPPGPPPNSGGYSNYGGSSSSKPPKEKKSGSSGMLLGAAGGLAAGAIGGALLHHVLSDSDSDSDDDRRRHETVIINNYNEYDGDSRGGYYRNEAPLPVVDADGNYVSESDRESVEEAREEYEERLAEVERSSSPSSSDYDELEEAREEYEEEYEETYDD